MSGDFQVASNIEAGDHSYIQEFWYSQTVRSVEITAGLQDLNSEFVSSEHSSVYLNSSFGIIPTISTNLAAPIFSLTNLGLTVKWHSTPKTTWISAIYDGNPIGFEDGNPYNIKWKLNSGDGSMLISEFQFSSGIRHLDGTYKLGIYFENNPPFTQNQEILEDSFYKNDYGFYFTGDQILWKNSDNSRRLAMFVQVSMTTEKSNLIPFYFGTGINRYGILNKHQEDALGVAVAHASLAGIGSGETTFELTYHVPLTVNVYMQPDFQFIVNPSGTGGKLPDSFVAIFRFGFDF